ncbi:inorganic diphosphatase [Mycoplasma sp. P36-A1]|uniref:inorganic diphosphatase n=1 Tax=Mycoplasma sp. P36-A1 TaxID=3252900 RepID=UPI003C307FEB
MEKLVVEALIEIPTGSQNKYEIDKETGRVKLDRVLYSSMFYPAEYGYIENTLAADNDPIDILVLTTYPTFPGCLIDARILGMLEMIDTGEEDVKLIAVAQDDPRFDHVESLDDLAPHTLKEIQNFFDTYKLLQNKAVETGRYLGVEDAKKYLDAAKEEYKKLNK